MLQHCRPVGRPEPWTHLFLDKEHDQHLEKNDPNEDAKGMAKSNASVGRIAICLQGPLTMERTKT